MVGEGVSWPREVLAVYSQSRLPIAGSRVDTRTQLNWFWFLSHIHLVDTKCFGERGGKGLLPLIVALLKTKQQHQQVSPFTNVHLFLVVASLSVLLFFLGFAPTISPFLSTAVHLEKKTNKLCKSKRSCWWYGNVQLGGSLFTKHFFLFWAVKCGWCVWQDRMTESETY